MNYRIEKALQDPFFIEDPLRSVKRILIFTEVLVPKSVDKSRGIDILDGFHETLLLVGCDVGQRRVLWPNS